MSPAGEIPLQNFDPIRAKRIDSRTPENFVNGGEFAADKLVPTDATDFSPLLLEIRNAKPDLVKKPRTRDLFL